MANIGNVQSQVQTGLGLGIIIANFDNSTPVNIPTDANQAYIWSGSISAVMNLPAANAVPAGWIVWIFNDGTGNASLQVVPAGSDTINGPAAPFTIGGNAQGTDFSNPIGVLLISDGNSPGNWRTFVVAGNGRLLIRKVVTSGTTYQISSLTRSIRVFLQAGGGGGGGAVAAINNVSVGGGGSAGGYAEKFFNNLVPGSTFTIAIGGAGVAGSIAGGDGGGGGNTTFTVGSTTVTANGGPGGTGDPVGVTTFKLVAGGAPPVVSTNGDLNGSGQSGSFGSVYAGTAGVSGQGGSCLYGAGGNAISGPGTGNNAIGFGAGGSGSFSGSATGQVGGAGTAGVIIVEEYS